MKKLLYNLLFAACCCFMANAQFISEFHYDNGGADVGEFVEVALPAGTSPTTFTITLYNNTGGAMYDSYTLTAGDFGSTDGTYDYYTWYPGSIQNGGSDGISLDNGGALVEFISYEGTLTANDGPASGITSTDVGVAEGSGTNVGESIAYDPVGGTWSTGAETPGAANAGGPPPSCSITGVSVSGVCSGADYVLTINYTAANLIDGVGAVEIFDITNSVSIGTATSSPVVFTFVGNTSTTTYDIVVRDFTDNSCVSSAVTVSPIDCSTPPPASCPGGFVNEFHYDNSGADIGEFVEVALPAGSNPADYTITLYNGSNGTSYSSFTLTATEFGSTDGTYDYYVWSPSSIQNGGPDGIALDFQGNVCDFVSYEGMFAATDGPANGMNSTDVGVVENGGTLAGQSLALDPNTGNWVVTTADTRGTGNTFAAVCSITNVSITSAGCVGADYQFEVNFTATDLVDAGGNVEVYDNTNSVVLGTATASPFNVVLSNNTSTTSFDIIVRDVTDNSCASTAVTVNPDDCSPAPGCNSNSGNFPWNN